MRMGYALYTVGGGGAEAITVTKRVAMSCEYVCSTVFTRPVSFTLASIVVILESVLVTGITVGGCWTSTSLIPVTDWVTRSLVYELVTGSTLPLPITMTISIFILGCVVNTEVTFGVGGSVAAITDWVARSEPEGTSFTSVSVITYACSVIVFIGISDTAITI